LQVIEIYSHQLLKYNWIDFKQTKKFLFHKIIPRAGSNHATGRIWPAGRTFDTPGLGHSVKRKIFSQKRH